MIKLTFLPVVQELGLVHSLSRREVDAGKMGG